MGIGAAVAACAGRDPDGTGFIDPLLWSKDKTVQAGLDSNPVEFDGIKSWIVESLPHAEEFHGATIAQPIANHIIRMVRIFEFGDVGKADEILMVTREHGYRGSLYFDHVLFCFAVHTTDCKP